MKFSKTRTLLCTLGAVFLCSAFAAVPARAETAFDPHYYFQKYPDVANVTGFDPQALFNHYESIENRGAGCYAVYRSKNVIPYGGEAR